MLLIVMEWQEKASSNVLFRHYKCGSLIQIKHFLYFFSKVIKACFSNKKCIVSN